jgi:hypothetical protein
MPHFRAPEGPSRSVPPVFLHIGTMKSGTTFLQHVLIENKEQLASAGYLFPGDTWKAQARAARDLTHFTRGDPVFRAEAEGAWRSLAGQMLNHRGAASIVSMEFLAYAGPRRARAATTSLEPAETHVILTVRDAARTIPGQWQTTVKARGTAGWDDYQARVRKAGSLRARLGRLSDPTAAAFRSIHDVARVLDAWGRSVPSDRLHVVTVPSGRTDPTLLWERFATVVGLDPDLGSSASPANESLGYASTELFRRVNLALTDVPLHEHVAIVKQQLGDRILARRSQEEAKPRLDRATYEFALEWNARTREAVARAGAHVVGDLDDLPTSPTEDNSDAVDDTQRPPTDDELLEAAQTAIDGMHRLVERQKRRAAGHGRAPDLSPSEDEAPGRTVDAPDPVSAAVARIAALSRTSMDLRRRIRA